MTPAAELDIPTLYAQMAAAPAESDEFELLAAEFNRRCQQDPQGIVDALKYREGLVSE